MAYANGKGCFGMTKSHWKGKRGSECPWYGVKKSNRENYVKSRLGDKNPAAKSYKVFNEHGELILERNANIQKTLY